jgi:DNA-binding CsgD family transcriptional regulator
LCALGTIIRIKREQSLVTAGASRFVGRERQLASLRRALAEPTVVLVEGEAGIGKSRLVRELVSTARDRRLLVGACQPHPQTLGPVVAALRGCRDWLAGSQPSPLAGALRPLFPDWADLPPAPEPVPDPKAARHRLFRALAELVELVGADALVVEDLHWADPATCEFLLYLAARWQGPPVGLVLTYRPEDVPGDSLLLRLTSRPAAIRVALSPLSDAETARLVSSMLDGGAVSEAFARFLHQRTDGVPLAVEESVRLLCARGDVVRHGGEWVRRRLDELQVPPTVREAVLERAGRLSPSAQRVLEAAAVLAEPADERLLAEVAGMADPSAGVAEAVAGGMLREDPAGRVGFRHALMAQAIYQAIPAADRRRLHERAGQALRAADAPSLVHLARHFRAAGATETWIEYAERAADAAVGSGDLDTAVVWLNDAVPVTGVPVPTRVRLARKLATAAHFRPGQVDDRHRQAIGTLRSFLRQTRLDPPDEAGLRLELGRLLAQLGEDEDAARTEIERAIGKLGHDPVEQARAIRMLAQPVIGDKPAATYRRWLRRAAELDPSRLPPAERLALLGDRANAMLYLGDEAGWALAAGLPATAGSAEERWHLVRGYANLGWNAILWGRYGEARRLLAAANELAEADRHTRYRPQTLASQALLDWVTGAWRGLPERMAPLASVPEESGSDDPDDPSALLAANRLAWLQLAQGGHRRLEAEFRRILDHMRRWRAFDELLEPAAGLGRLLLRQGRAAAAVQATDAPIRTVQNKGVWLRATELVPVRVEALLVSGERDGAGELAAAYQDGLRGCPAPAAAAALATCRALFDPALWAEAAAAWEALPRPYDALLARERQAVHTGDESLLGQTFQGLSDLGARGDAERVAAALRDRGIEVRRRWRRGRRGYGDRLSPSEREVVRLVVTGATNREVAGALSRSPKTVAGQLSSAMRKLGVASRTELAVRVTTDPSLLT